MNRLLTLALFMPALAWSAPHDPAEPSRALSDTPAVQGVPTDPDNNPALDTLRAEYLIRFLSYVTWPAARMPPAGQPLVIAISGANGVFEALGAAIQGRLAHTRPIARLLVGEGERLRGVHLLYLGPRTDLGAHPLARAARTQPVVLVGEHPDALAAGAVFNLTQTGEQLRFEASTAAAGRVGLVISSRLLTLAERVQGGP